MQPFFIIGTERSGTNLLRLILNAHSQIAIPHPPHIFKNFYSRLSNYGDLSIDRNFRHLVNDVITMVSLHNYPWEIKFDKERAFNSTQDRTLIAIFFYIYDQYLKSTNKKRFGCKSTFMIYHMEKILAHCPSAKFIYMVRDGRDVLVSAKKSIFNNFTAYYVAKRWKREQHIGIRLLNELPADRICLIQYETLLQKPEETIRQICQFLKEPFEQKMMRYFDSTEAKKSGSLSNSWKNTSKPILQKNFNKFQKQLKEKEIELFEMIAYQELSYFGYSPITASKSLAQRQQLKKWKWQYALQEMYRYWLAQLSALCKDKNNWLRFKKFIFLSSRKLRGNNVR